MKPETFFQRLGHRAAGNKGLRSDENCKLNFPPGRISVCLTDASSRKPRLGGEKGQPEGTAVTSSARRFRAAKPDLTIC
ncbi:MAG: hypothetical protein GYA43_03350 [Bacteroidales bacterium]|nr:hypothetical protein [Bacteroidales bacterium]